jgi:hypothetical protein
MKIRDILGEKFDVRNTNNEMKEVGLCDSIVIKESSKKSKSGKAAKKRQLYTLQVLNKNGNPKKSVACVLHDMHEGGKGVTAFGTWKHSHNTAHYHKVTLYIADVSPASSRKKKKNRKKSYVLFALIESKHVTKLHKTGAWHAHFEK